MPHKDKSKKRDLSPAKHSSDGGSSGEAESEEEARQIAQGMDGGDFTANGGGDWAIDSVTETQWEYV